ncbi:MerR family transcriptional regulator [Candidatus Moduliflexota bacterium]
MKELATETGLDPRKIRFYIAEKLLNGPESRGRHARYTDYHLRRLRAIRTMSEVYRMPLKEIRRQLLRAGDEDIEVVAFGQDSKGRWREIERPPPSPARMSSLEGRARMARERAAESMEDYSHEIEEPLFKLSLPEEAGAAERSTPIDTLVRSLKDALPAGKASATSRGETWRVIEITPEVKLQVKDVFSEEDVARFEEVADYVREILLGGDET